MEKHYHAPKSEDLLLLTSPKKVKSKARQEKGTHMKNGVLPAKNALAEYSRSNYNDSGPRSSLNTSRGEILITTGNRFSWNAGRYHFRGYGRGVKGWAYEVGLYVNVKLVWQRRT